MEQNIQQQSPGMNCQGANDVRPEGAARPTLSFKEALDSCFGKYATFSGRSRRSEYWWYWLFGAILAMILTAIIVITSLFNGKNFPEDYTYVGAVIIGLCVVVLLLIGLFLMIPSLAVTTRRLHDTGRSGWWLVSYYGSYFVARVVESMIVDKLAVRGACNCQTGGFLDGIINAFHVNPVGCSVVAVFTLLYLGLGITIFIFTLLDSHKGENKYGCSPKFQ